MCALLYIPHSHLLITIPTLSTKSAHIYIHKYMYACIVVRWQDGIFARLLVRSLRIPQPVVDLCRVCLLEGLLTCCCCRVAWKMFFKYLNYVFDPNCFVVCVLALEQELELHRLVNLNEKCVKSSKGIWYTSLTNTHTYTQSHYMPTYIHKYVKHACACTVVCVLTKLSKQIKKDLLVILKALRMYNVLCNSF